MKKIFLSIIFVFNLLILVGCDIESLLDDNSMQSENVEIEENENNENNETNENEDNENEITDNLNNQFKFDNYESLTYNVEIFDLISARIKKANYMPELSTVCIDVEINDQNYRYNSYIARLGPKSGSQSGARDKIFEINSSHDSIYLCFNELTTGENYIHVARSLPSEYNAHIMLTFSFNDQQFSSRSKLTAFNIYNKTERSVELGISPNLMIDFRVVGDKEAIGKLVLKVFDLITSNEIHKKEFTKDDVVFNGDVGYISDYKIEGLAHNYEYHVAMLYYPPSDLENGVLIDTADLKSTSIYGINNTCFYHYLYSYIYNIEYYHDSTTFKTFIKNDDNFLNTSTGQPNKLNFNVYSPEGSLLSTTPVVDGQESVIIPNEYLFIDGYVTIEIESTKKELCRKLINVDNLKFDIGVSKEKAIFELLEIPDYLKEVNVEIWDHRGYQNNVLIGVYENIDLITGVQHLEFNQGVSTESMSSYEYTVTYKISLFNNEEVTKNISGYRGYLSIITD